MEGADGIGRSQTGDPWSAFYAEAGDLQAVLDRAESMGAKTTMDRPESDGDSVLPDLAVWEGFCVIYGNPAGPCRTR